MILSFFLVIVSCSIFKNMNITSEDIVNRKINFSEDISKESYIYLENDSVWSGKLSCNLFKGNYIIENNRYIFTINYQTYMQCTEENSEKILKEVLTQGVYFLKKNNNFFLISEKNKIEVFFNK